MSSPAPIKGLTPTLENSRRISSPRCEQTSKECALVNDQTTVPKIWWDDDLSDTRAELMHMSPPSEQVVQKSDIEETPQLNLVRTKSRLRSFASEKMRSVRRGSDIGSVDSNTDTERKSLQSMLNDCGSSDEGEGDLEHSRKGRKCSANKNSIEYECPRKNSIENESDGSLCRNHSISSFGDISSPSRCPSLSTDFDETPLGSTGSGKKRRFVDVGKSPLGKGSSWNQLSGHVNRSTGLTTEIHMLKLGDEHLLKRRNSLPMEVSRTRETKSHNTCNNSVGSDSVFLNSSPVPDSEIEIFRTRDIFDVHDMAKPMFSISSIGSTGAANHSQSLLRQSEPTSFHTPENFIIPSNYSTPEVSCEISFIGAVSSVAETDLDASSQSSQDSAVSKPDQSQNVPKETGNDSIMWNSPQRLQKKKAMFRFGSLCGSTGSYGSGRHAGFGSKFKVTFSCLFNTLKPTTVYRFS
jgi:hypothetical protein